MAWIKANTAEAGKFYRTRKGRILRVVAPGKVSSRWPTIVRGGAGDAPTVPYRSYADPKATSSLYSVDTFGWLPADYELFPCPAPRHVSDEIRRRGALARKNFGVSTERKPRD